MLDISRLDAGTVEPNFQHFPLRDLFRRLHMHFAGQAELAGLGLRFSPGGKSVTSDPQLLERILGNLIQNAIRYTERGGIVVVARTQRRRPLAGARIDLGRRLDRARHLRGLRRAAGTRGQRGSEAECCRRLPTDDPHGVALPSS